MLQNNGQWTRHYTAIYFQEDFKKSSKQIQQVTLNWATAVQQSQNVADDEITKEARNTTSNQDMAQYIKPHNDIIKLG